MVKTHSREDEGIAVRITSESKKGWGDLLKILLSVIIGGLVTLSANYAQHHWQQASTRQNLQLAFRGEISALIDLENQDREHWDAALERLIKKDAAKQEGGRPWKMIEPNEAIRFTVFESSASKLGLLDSPLPELIANFYAVSARWRAEMHLFSSTRILLASETERTEMVTQHRKTRQKWEDVGRELLGRLSTLQN